MFIENIKLYNFRNFTEFSSSFKKYNIIYGKNSSGKTSLIEAIYFLIKNHSFKGLKLDSTILKKHSNFFSIEGSFNFKSSKYLKKIIYTLNHGKKIHYFNPETSQKISIKDLNSEIYIVVLDTKKIIESHYSMGERRDWFDKFLISVIPDYKNVIEKYKNILQTKKSYIFNYSKNINKELDKNTKKVIKNLNKQLSHLIEFIKHHRNSLVNYLNKEIKNYQINFFEKKCKIIYNTEFKTLTKHEIEDLLNENIEFEFYKERLLGIHTDSILFLYDGIATSKIASFSFLKIFNFLINLIFAKFIMDKENYKTIFLFDDFFQEIDNINSEKIFKLLEPYQVFITTTTQEKFNNLTVNNTKIIGF